MKPVTWLRIPILLAASSMLAFAQQQQPATSTQGSGSARQAHEARIDELLELLAQDELSPEAREQMRETLQKLRAELRDARSASARRSDRAREVLDRAKEKRSAQNNREKAAADATEIHAQHLQDLLRTHGLGGATEETVKAYDLLMREHAIAGQGKAAAGVQGQASEQAFAELWRSLAHSRDGQARDEAHRAFARATVEQSHARAMAEHAKAHHDEAAAEGGDAGPVREQFLELVRKAMSDSKGGQQAAAEAFDQAKVAHERALVAERAAAAAAHDHAAKAHAKAMAEHAAAHERHPAAAAQADDVRALIEEMRAEMAQIRKLMKEIRAQAKNSAGGGGAGGMAQAGGDAATARRSPFGGTGLGQHGEGHGLGHGDAHGGSGTSRSPFVGAWGLGAGQSMGGGSGGGFSGGLSGGGAAGTHAGGAGDR